MLSHGDSRNFASPSCKNKKPNCRCIFSVKHFRSLPRQFKITAERVFRERYRAAVSIRTRPIAARQASPPPLAGAARDMECDLRNVLLLRGDLQNAPKHGKGVVARQPSGALSWEINEQINLKRGSVRRVAFSVIHRWLFIAARKRSGAERAFNSVALDSSAAACKPLGRSAGRRVAELVRPRGPLFAATQIVEIKTFTLRERYEVLLLRTSCYAGRSAAHSKLCSESFFICHFLLSADWKLELFMCSR